MPSQLARQLPAAVGMVLIFTIVTGLLYPLAVTGIAQVAFADKANGSLVEADGRTVGSSLIGQEFTGTDYFHSRPSAIDFDARDSGGANYGPTNPVLLEEIQEYAQEYREENGLAADGEVPVDAVTMSASGLDPNISAANAEIQASRVAEARGLSKDEVLDLIAAHTTGRGLGFLGEPSVDVLDLNVALDEMS